MPMTYLCALHVVTLFLLRCRITTWPCWYRQHEPISRSPEHFLVTPLLLLVDVQQLPTNGLDFFSSLLLCQVHVPAGTRRCTRCAHAYTNPHEGVGPSPLHHVKLALSTASFLNSPAFSSCERGNDEHFPNGLQHLHSYIVALQLVCRRQWLLMLSRMHHGLSCGCPVLIYCTRY